jgi:hypothetical protein
MTGFRERPLDGTTWPDFARLVERHNGVWGGCWCMAFHPDHASSTSVPTSKIYPEDTGGRKVSASFLHNGTLAMFESHGFERTRRIGKHHWVVTKVVLGASRRATASRRSSPTVR